MRTLYTIGITLFLLIICLLHPYFNGTNKLISYIHYFVYGNRIDISIDDDLDINKVELVFKNESQIYFEKTCYFRGSNTYDKPIKVIVFKNGKQKSNIPYIYGKQVMEIFYDNIKIGEVWHWQTLKFHSHTYHITFSKKKQKIMCTSTISGPDAEW